MSVEVPITIAETEGIPRVRQPVTMGLPFPATVLRDASHLALAGQDGTPLPLQAEALSRWPDGSVKWCLLDFQVDIAPWSSAQPIVRVLDQPPPPAAAGLRLVEGAARFEIHTGVATYSIGRAHLLPGSWTLDGGARLEQTFAGQCALEDDAGHVYIPRVESLAIETFGSMRTTLWSSGAFTADGREHCRFVARQSFFANSPVVRVALTVHNPRPARHPQNLWDLGDAGSIYIRDLHLALRVPDAGARALAYSITPDVPLVHVPDGDLEIYQDSSGGENWDSRTHVNREGEVTTSFRGYRVRTRAGERTGDRAQPLVVLHAGAAGVAVAVREFWQNFPQAVEARGRSLLVRLLPPQSRDAHELQGGEQKTYVAHVALLASAEGAEDVAWIRGRLAPHATPGWYCSSRAIRHLTPRSAEDDKDYLALVDAAIDGPTSFAAKREIIDEYGWRNFGDIYADHETVHADGPGRVVSHYNNQYDVVYGALLQFLRTGDARWFAMADELARHVVDIDIYHTDGDRPEYSGGMFWHTNHYTSAFTSTHRSLSRRARKPGGGPSTGHCYTAGLTHHYFMTGEIASRDAVIGLARWIIAMEDGKRSRFRWIDRGPTGCASATHDAWYHGPGRGPANAASTLLDAFLLTDDREFLEMAEALIRRCIHPRDDIEARQLLDAERRWSYTMFLQMLGWYLDLKRARGEIDAMYGYGREALLAYARWMAEREVPNLTHPERLEYPTETWSAQDMRKCDILNVAARHAAAAERERFRERAAFFFRSSVDELSAAPTRTFTRPVAIMMTCGHTAAYVRQHSDETMPAGPPADFGRPARFVPQRGRVLARLTALAGAGLAATIASGCYRLRGGGVRGHSPASRMEAPPAL